MYRDVNLNIYYLKKMANQGPTFEATPLLEGPKKSDIASKIWSASSFKILNVSDKVRNYEKKVRLIKSIEKINEEDAPELFEELNKILDENDTESESESEILSESEEALEEIESKLCKAIIKTGPRKGSKCGAYDCHIPSHNIVTASGSLEKKNNFPL